MQEQRLISACGCRGQGLYYCINCVRINHDSRCLQAQHEGVLVSLYVTPQSTLDAEEDVGGAAAHQSGAAPPAAPPGFVDSEKTVDLFFNGLYPLF